MATVIANLSLPLSSAFALVRVPWLGDQQLTTCGQQVAYDVLSFGCLIIFTRFATWCKRSEPINWKHETNIIRIGSGVVPAYRDAQSSRK